MRLENNNQNNLQMNDNFHLNDNGQALNYNPQLQIQQEEFRGQEIYENQEISIIQSEQQSKIFIE